MAGARGLFKGRKQRRDAGLLLMGDGQLLDRARQMKESGEITGDMTREELAAALLGAQIAANPVTYAEAGFDWDALLAFLEKLIPLILMLIGGL